MVVCPFCLSIYMSELDEGDTCPECEVDQVIDYEDYKLRLSASFMENISKDRGTDDGK
jgi:hypothetical protein